MCSPKVLGREGVEGYGFDAKFLTPIQQLLYSVCALLVAQPGVDVFFVCPSSVSVEDYGNVLGVSWVLDLVKQPLLIRFVDAQNRENFLEDYLLTPPANTLMGKYGMSYANAPAF